MVDVPNLYTMNEVAAKLHKSRRWLQDFIRDNPCGRKAGRTRLFTDADLSKLIDALPREEPKQSYLSPQKRVSPRSVQHIGRSQSDTWNALQELLSKKRN